MVLVSLAAGKIGVGAEGHLPHSYPQMSHCDSCPWKCRAERRNGERTQQTSVHSNAALQAEGFKGRTNSRVQADRTANCHLLSLCRLSMLPSEDSHLGAGACCWVGPDRLGLGTREREKRGTPLVQSPGPASLQGLGKGHVACWDQEQHHGSLGIQVILFQLVVWGFYQSHWIYGNEHFPEGCLNWQNPGGCKWISCTVHGHWKEREQLRYKMQKRY